MFGKKKNAKPKSKARKIIEWVLTGVFAAAIVGVGVLQIINKTSKNQSVFGDLFQKVLTDSMAPDYKVNDIIFLERANPSDLKKRVDAGKNVDVSFKWNINGTEVSMTHRLQMVTYYEEVQTDPITGETYQYRFVAHGINKKSMYCQGYNGEYKDCTTQTQTFNENALIGRVVRKSYFMTFATSIWGLLVLLLIPCLYLIISSVFDICKALDDKEEVPADGQVVGEATEGGEPIKKDPLAGLSEKEKEKLKKQMLDEMLGKKK